METKQKRKSMESTDGNCVGNLKKKNIGKDSFERTNSITVTPAVHHEHPFYYKMNHKNRGLALIFNHEKFDVYGCPARQGTNLDRSNLAIRLKNLGFHVKIFQDLNKHRILEEIAAASRWDHSESDCFLVVVLSHGDPGVLYAKDRPYEYEHIWMPFIDKRCPSLAGKPKLFFIQACQGDQVDDGITLSRTQTDGSTSNNLHLVITHPDFLIAYSTIPGHYSWRRTVEGSWFINALCTELDFMTSEHDIMATLTFVNQRVALDYESNCMLKKNMHLKKQIPCVTSTLTCLVKFTKSEAW